MLTLANLVTIARMITIPLLITLLLSNHHGWAFGVFVFAGITDALDGVLARRYKQSSGLGAFLDPTTCFIVLSLPDHPRAAPDFHIANHVPLYLTIVSISRDVFIVMIALLVHLTSGITRFTPTFLGKLTTATQVVMIGSVLLLNAFEQDQPILVSALAWLTLAITLASGFHYIYHATRVAGADEAA